MTMIEFRGQYQANPGAEALTVLVQYDHFRLHIWRVSNPFHHLCSSDHFRLKSSSERHCHVIALPEGGQIITNDSAAIRQLTEKLPFRRQCRQSIRQWIFYILSGLATLILIAWWVIGQLV